MSFVGTLALLGAMSLAGAAPANAVVSCNPPGISSTGASITCWGSGEFRMAYVCPKYWAWETTWVKYGWWVSAPISTYVNTGTTCASINKPYVVITYR